MPTCTPTPPPPTPAAHLSKRAVPAVPMAVALRSHQVQARRQGHVLMLVAIPVDGPLVGTVQRRIRSTDTLLQTPGGVAVVPVRAPTATQAAEIARLIADRFAQLRLGADPKVLLLDAQGTPDVAAVVAECEATRFAPA